MLGPAAEAGLVVAQADLVQVGLGVEVVAGVAVGVGVGEVAVLAVLAVELVAVGVVAVAGPLLTGRVDEAEDAAEGVEVVVQPLGVGGRG